MKSPLIFAVAIGLVIAGSAPAIADSQPEGAKRVPPKQWTKPPAPPAANNRLHVRSDGWIVYPSLIKASGMSSTSRKTLRVRKVKGKRVNGDCIFEGSASTEGSKSVYVEETAFNPKTCDYEETTIQPTSQDYARLDAATASAGGLSQTPASSVASAAITPASSSHYAHATTFWIDPINITISRVTANVKWSGAHTLQYTRPNKYGFSFWLPTTFGRWVYDETYPIYSDSWRSGRYFTNKVKFQNDTFLKWVEYTFGPGGWAACGKPSSSRARFFHKVTAWGHNGHSHGAWRDSKSGACANLVHHNHEVDPGWRT